MPASVQPVQQPNFQRLYKRLPKCFTIYFKGFQLIVQHIVQNKLELEYSSCVLLAANLEQFFRKGFVNLLKTCVTIL